MIMCVCTQIVHLFTKYDVDASGELDTNEIRKLMFESDVSPKLYSEHRCES